MDHFSSSKLKMLKTHVVDSKPCCFLLSFIWRLAMTEPENPELPSLGVFECMTKLIKKSLENVQWVMSGQNIYVPYYAAHIIGSYTMKNQDFAEKAIESGVILPLLELMRGKMSWVEERVAVRALGHLASYEKTFEEVARFEDELVILAMEIATTCVDTVFKEFVSVEDRSQGKVKYQSDLLTRGFGGLEIEDQRAEEWASQLQCWSLHLLSCFAYKQRCVSLICNTNFLEKLSQMWGGLVNHSSPAGIGLIRILCYTKKGRGHVADSKEIVLSLCNLSRSSDDWQYMGIDCLLLLLKDQETRNKVLETSLFYLVDLIELKNLKDRQNIGDRIAKVLLTKVNGVYNHKIQKGLREVLRNKVERRKREKKLMNDDEKMSEISVLVSLIKQQANQFCCVGDIEEAIKCYDEAIRLCPLKLRRKRMNLYSERGECKLVFGDVDSAISDCTKALCLSEPVNSHGKSLWIRSRAYDIKGLSRESLMDCIMFINGGCLNGKIPYYVAQMISKQMEATWLFQEARTSKKLHFTGLSTITEEIGKKNEGIRSRMFKQMKKDVPFSIL